MNNTREKLFGDAVVKLQLALLPIEKIVLAVED